MWSPERTVVFKRYVDGKARMKPCEVYHKNLEHCERSRGNKRILLFAQYHLVGVTGLNTESLKRQKTTTTRLFKCNQPGRPLAANGRTSGAPL